MEVGDDADDCFNSANLVRVPDLLPYGVFVGPAFPGQGFVDEHDIGRAGFVVHSKVASPQNRENEPREEYRPKVMNRA